MKQKKKINNKIQKRYEDRVIDKETFKAIAQALYASDYVLVSVVGFGSHSVVCKCIDSQFGDIVCVKVIYGYDGYDTSGIPSICLNEICILHYLNHPNLMKVKDVSISHRMILMEYEYHEQGDIVQYMESKKKYLSKLEIGIIAAQLIMGLEYLHSMNVIHRDIKPVNIMVSNEGLVKIGDFGVSIPFNFIKKQKLISEVGTLWYRAPELLLGFNNYNTNVDIWSLGCLIAELFTGKPLFEYEYYDMVGQFGKILETIPCPTREEYPEMYKSDVFRSGILRKKNFKEQTTSIKQLMVRNYLSRDVKKKMEKADDNLIDLLQKMLEINPKKRISAYDALMHPYFKLIVTKMGGTRYRNEIEKSGDSMKKRLKKIKKRK